MSRCQESSPYYQTKLDDEAQNIRVIYKRTWFLQNIPTTSRNEKRIRIAQAINREFPQRIGWNNLFSGRRTGIRWNETSK